MSNDQSIDIYHCLMISFLYPWYVCMQTYCLATWIVGSSTCGLWQGVCTTPLY